MPKITPPKTPLGAAIRRVREDILRYSQEELGVKLDVKPNVISRWETGTNVPDVESLARIARLAGKTGPDVLRLYSEFIYRAGFPRPDLEPWRVTIEEVAPSGADAHEVPLLMAHDEDAGTATVEGQMARSIVDFVRDRERRWELVQGLRAQVEQWQGGQGGTPRGRDQGSLVPTD